MSHIRLLLDLWPSQNEHVNKSILWSKGWVNSMTWNAKVSKHYLQSFAKFLVSTQMRYQWIYFKEANANQNDGKGVVWFQGTWQKHFPLNYLVRFPNHPRSPCNLAVALCLGSCFRSWRESTLTQMGSKCSILCVVTVLALQRQRSKFMYIIVSVLCCVVDGATAATSNACSFSASWSVSRGHRNAVAKWCCVRWKCL